MNQNRNAVWLLVALVAAVVGGEYFLLLYVPPRDVGWYNKLLNVYMKGGWLIRVVFALIIPWLLLYPTMPTWQETKRGSCGSKGALLR